MPTEKEIADVFEISLTIFLFVSFFLYSKVTIAYKVLCEFCNGPCIGDYLRCRVCIKAYHSQCLYERGHMNDQAFILPRLARQDWSCPDCVNILLFFI
jgi:hypothetical protein